MPAQANQPLPAGTALHGYRIVRVLAAGGFSFVYLAHDPNEQPVAIKEYLPSAVALRVNGAAQPQVADENAALFSAGMKYFFEEAGALARLSHPNVMRVLDFFRANETAYLVMRYERGRALNEHITSLSGPVEELWIRNTFAQLLDGLREVHTAKLLHLDIKPANVYLRNDGTPLLIDFGAARQVLSAEGVKLPPLYTPGFASPEMHDQPGARTVERYLFGRGDHVCLPGARNAAAGQCAQASRYGGPREPCVVGEVRRRPARDHRLVPASGPPATSAERLCAAESPAG
jgi:serine/threonine protein kinase